MIGALDSRNDFKEFLKWFDREEAAELRANKNAADDQYVPSVALDALREAMKTLIGQGFGSPYFNREHKFVIEPEDGGAPLLVTQLSQGYQSMLALGMDFARRLALANSHLDYGNADSIAEALAQVTEACSDIENMELPISAPLIAPAIMLVDEIDLHLHPIWQQRVLTDLMRAFPNTQFIVTTHSPQVLTSVDASCVRIIKEIPDAATEKQMTVAEGVTQQIKGVPSSDVLSDIMGANPVPPVQESAWLADYIAKIENATHGDVEGVALRRKLEDHFGAHHPLILDADRLIRFQAFKLHRNSTAHG